VLEACFLGQFRLHAEVYHCDITMRSPARSLFAFLSLNPDRKFRREVLAAELWGQPPMDIMKRLRQALHEIKLAFNGTPLDHNDFLAAETGTIEFIGNAPIRTDVHKFMALTSESLSDTPSEADAIALQKAAGLYQGDLLPGCHDDWCLGPRELLRLQYLNALECVMHHHLHRSEWNAAIAAGAKLLAHDPILEHIHRKIMASHQMKGDRASAIAQYESCKRTLQQKLGVSPMKETTQLYERIIADADMESSTVIDFGLASTGASGAGQPIGALLDGALNTISGTERSLQSMRATLAEAKRRTDSG